MNNEQKILDLVQRWAHAERDGDTDAYSQLLTPDFVGVGPVGFVLTGEQWAQHHHGDLTNHEFEVTDPHVRFCAPGRSCTSTEQPAQKTWPLGGHRGQGCGFRLSALNHSRDG